VALILKKLFGFNRDYRYWLEKGDGLLNEEKYADARDAFSEAMRKMAESGVEDASLQAEVREKYAETGNRLGRMNLDEAGYAFAGGDTRKAEEHLRVALDLAEDAALRKEAENLFVELSADTPKITMDDEKHSCSDCADDAEHVAPESHRTDELLDMEDRFELYVHTLPGDLPERYKSLGAKFARGCLLNLDGQGEEALKVFTELSAIKENDIINYEIALTYYRKGDLNNCERALRRAIDLNAMNPLSYISLVQLFGETGRIAESLPFLQHMINNELVPDQARLLLGDAYILLEDDGSAVECYSRVLSSPGYAKDAAMKLIPLLEKQGRREDAAYLAKKFKKGCC
jgi:tetratricopeptide (TPR) repeat protein